MGEVQDRQGTGYPSKITAVGGIGVGGVPLERVQHEAEVAAVAEVTSHESVEDPHPQYVDADELAEATPRFTQFYKWGA